MKTFAAYSYAADPCVPGFDDTGPRVVMDGQCALCAKGARWIARGDRANEFRIIQMQSPLGAALLDHYGLDPDDPESWLYIVDGRAFTSMDAIIRVGFRLGGVWKVLAVLRILPQRLQDGIYGWAARRRLKLAKGKTICELPDPAVKARLL